MCGIVAFHAPCGGAPGGEALAAMNREHALRGPDAAGAEVLAGGRVSLAHTRLSVIDLSAAAMQPMQLRDGRQWVVFNGEIYNFAELRAALEMRGETFATRSDTEVLLRLVTREGPAALDRLEGMFAFVHVDLDAGTMLAARDRLGIKPLYVAEVGGMTGFSSTLGPLTRMPGFHGHIDPRARFEMLVSKYVAAPRSIYAQARKVRPGHMVRLAIGEDRPVRQERWWSPSAWMVPAEAPVGADAPEEAWIDTLEDAVRGAVRRQMVADVPVGVFLSGGVDSSLVAALAARKTRGIRTFSVGYAESRYDESVHAEAVARHIGAEHMALRVGPRDVMDALADAGAAYDEPFGDASAVPTMLVSALARRHVTVALSGDGGDEQFLGYTRHHLMARARPLVRWTPTALRRLAARLAGPAPRTRWRHALAAFFAFPDEARLYTHHVLENFAAQAELAGAGARDMLWESGLHAASRRAREMSGDDFLRALCLTDLMGYLSDDCLVKVDRASMARSLEVRVPLLDEAVLRVSLNMPMRLSWSGGRGKAALRAVLARHVPPALTDRAKQGFGVPLDKWLFGPMREHTLAVLSRPRVEAAGLDFAGVERIMVAHQRGVADFQYFLWPLMCYVQWHAGRSRM